MKRQPISRSYYHFIFNSAKCCKRHWFLLQNTLISITGKRFCCFQKHFQIYQIFLLLLLFFNYMLLCLKIFNLKIYLIFYQKLKEAERQRINKLEELDRKANVQLERQLVLASEWSRALMTMCGRLKGTELDPENSHRIDFSDFWKLLNSNSVQYMEYSNYGQTVSGREFVLRCLWKFNF